MIQKYMGDRKDEDDIGTGREVRLLCLLCVVRGALSVLRELRVDRSFGRL